MILRAIRRMLSFTPIALWYAARAPRDERVGWDRYWTAVARDGADTPSPWSASDEERVETVEVARRTLDTSLPLVDVGCGDGGFARALSPCFPRVVAIDRSARAIDLARRVPASGGNLSWRVLDATSAEAIDDLARELGPSNVLLRDMAHVLGDDRSALVANLASLTEHRGAVLCMQPFEPDLWPYDWERLGATAAALPPAIRRLVEAGLPTPSLFDREGFTRLFARDEWEARATGCVPRSAGERMAMSVPRVGDDAGEPLSPASCRRVWAVFARAELVPWEGAHCPTGEVDRARWAAQCREWCSELTARGGLTLRRDACVRCGFAFVCRTTIWSMQSTADVDNDVVCANPSCRARWTEGDGRGG